MGRVEETPSGGERCHGVVGQRWIGQVTADRLQPFVPAYAPFGGTGASGNGSRFGSQSSWDKFTQWQWVTARPQAHGFPF
jgi:acyl-CoA reductase-like NAD-dependent aldehyde dehydrogenase